VPLLELRLQFCVSSPIHTQEELSDRVESSEVTAMSEERWQLLRCLASVKWRPITKVQREMSDENNMGPSEMPSTVYFTYLESSRRDV
jgi:hypothetical protein